MNWKEFYKALNDAREGQSWRSLAKAVGVTPSVFTRMSQGKPISVENLIKILRDEICAVISFKDFYLT